MSADHVEIEAGDTVWRFERSFVSSNWTCIYGAGCHGILPERAADLQQGCCSFGAHLGDGSEGRSEALNVAAFASVLTDEQWQFHDVFEAEGPAGIFSDGRRTHTRIVDDACIFLNRPGFHGGGGCALHVGALAAGDSPTEWKPSVCWQLPIRVDWEQLDGGVERATVRRWTRDDWGEFGSTMAWCCTERDDGAEAFCGDEPVVESMADELIAIVGQEVYVDLTRRLS